ncbi:MAG: glycosyltransferase family 2 protein [Isosphaeraceae bacterium]|nr:glycosyltransferase family 2 protein [Isosphaeraceae bacterium]
MIDLRRDHVHVKRIIKPNGPDGPWNSNCVIAVLPAYNAEKTLAATLADVPAGCIDQFILVDDGSTDHTVEVARDMGLTVFVHPENRGYGGNQKTCYREALAAGADIIVMIHPDYQYDTRVVAHAIGFIELGICDIVLGNRVRSRHEAMAGGMPLYKYVSNRFLTAVENLALGQNLGDFHSGFRVYRREVLERVSFEANSNDFVFDTQLLVQAVRLGFRLGDVPMPVRYFPEASSINFKRSLHYGLGTLGVLAEYWLERASLRRSPLFSPRPHSCH